MLQAMQCMSEEATTRALQLQRQRRAWYHNQARAALCTSRLKMARNLRIAKLKASLLNDTQLMGPAHYLNEEGGVAQDAAAKGVAPAGAYGPSSAVHGSGSIDNGSLEVIWHRVGSRQQPQRQQQQQYRALSGFTSQPEVLITRVGNLQNHHSAAEVVHVRSHSLGRAPVPSPLGLRSDTNTHHGVVALTQASNSTNTAGGMLSAPMRHQRSISDPLVHEQEVVVAPQHARHGSTSDLRYLSSSWQQPPLQHSPSELVIADPRMQLILKWDDLMRSSHASGDYSMAGHGGMPTHNLGYSASDGAFQAQNPEVQNPVLCPGASEEQQPHKQGFLGRLLGLGQKLTRGSSWEPTICYCLFILAFVMDVTLLTIVYVLSMLLVAMLAQHKLRIYWKVRRSIPEKSVVWSLHCHNLLVVVHVNLNLAIGRAIGCSMWTVTV